MPRLRINCERGSEGRKLCGPNSKWKPFCSDAVNQTAGAIAGFDDADGDAALAQKMRAGEAGDSGADDEDRW